MELTCMDGGVTWPHPSGLGLGRGYGKVVFPGDAPKPGGLGWDNPKSDYQSGRERMEGALPSSGVPKDNRKRGYPEFG